ncbi:HAD family hydrolase [Candidatus Pacearchaeota archaeon]|nr:HAD family hydrolase [Candidatus Pacearchaeota archaeon]|tara:strand:- start:125 stop:766 length:642 start_codon:yes stop_codon:yes gene_type:complete
MLSLELVIFDLDGVLVDACEWHRVALNEALKEVCGYEIPLEEHYKTFNGLPTNVKLEKLISRDILDATQQQKVYALKQSKTIEIIAQHCERSQEKIDLIKWLKDKAIIVACFTNSIRETAYLMLENTGIIDELDYILTNQDVDKPKPDPEGYKKVLHYFDVLKDNAMIVEDSPKGLKAAYASGCKVLKVKNATEVNTQNLKEFIDESFNSNGG